MADDQVQAEYPKFKWKLISSEVLELQQLEEDIQEIQEAKNDLIKSQRHLAWYVLEDAQSKCTPG
jgi:hypothetical protein